MKLKDVTLPGEEKSVKIGMGATLVPPHLMEQHLIAQVGCGEMQLISLESGNRLNNGVKVNNPCSLARDELYKLCGSSFGKGPEWELVGQFRGRILQGFMKLKDVTLPGEEKSVRIGMGAILESPAGERYLVAQTDIGWLQLINQKSGQRKNDGAYVEDIHDLTRQEMNKLIGVGLRDQWKLVSCTDTAHK